MDPSLKLALVGAGMFGGDVHLRAYSDLQRFGIAGQLARVGMDELSRELAPVKFDLVAVGTRSEKSAVRASSMFAEWTGSTPRAYFGSKPVALSAVGQKKRLVRDGINAYDAVQVRVEFENGMSINFHNNWITPPEFEGPVNQGHEIVGADGKVESDQQYRGFRWWNAGGASRTANNHFTRDVRRPDGSVAYVGYGVDSLTAGLAAICRLKFFGATRQSLASIYPTAEDARITVAIVHAARIVRDLNFKYLKQGKGAPVTARFGKDGITIIDPNRGNGRKVFERIYKKAV